MIIEIHHKNPQEDGIYWELIEIFKLQAYEDKWVYHTKQAGIPIEKTVFDKDAMIYLVTKTDREFIRGFQQKDK